MPHAPRTLVLICSFAAIAGCARDNREVTSTGGSEWRASPARGAPPGAASAANYVAAAAAIDLFVVRSSELALQRSTRARTRDFASQEIAAHKGLASQLSFAGRRLNLLPSATLPARYQALIDRLQTAPDLDATYRQEQLQVHREALSLHSNYAAAGRSPTLRPVAAAAVPIIERHLRLIPYL